MMTQSSQDKHHHAPSLDVTVVVPLLDEQESLAELAEGIAAAMENLSYEVVFVDDGSRDGSWSVIESLHQANPETIKGIRFTRNYGKSAALQKGFQAARGAVVFTMDADLQDNPKELPEMRQQLLDQNLDLVSGWKKKRHDPLSKTIPTKLYNWATRRVSGIQLNDFNCGLKCYRWHVVKRLKCKGRCTATSPCSAKWLGSRELGRRWWSTAPVHTARANLD